MVTLKASAARADSMARTSGDDTIRLNGSASRDDVDAERFEVDGTATVERDVRAREVSVDGALDVGGALEGEEVDLDGSATVGGDTRAEYLAVDGSGTFEGALSVDHLDADGSTTVAGTLDGHEIESDGSTTIEGNLVANEAEFDGSVTVDGLAEVTDLDVDGSGTFGDVGAGTVEVVGAIDADAVTADRVEVELGGDATVDSIVGGEVLVRRRELPHSILSWFLNRGEPILRAGTIEGSTVEVDATDAETVAAPTVELGPDVAVDVVYADDLDADEGAIVGDVRPHSEYERPRSGRVEATAIEEAGSEAEPETEPETESDVDPIADDHEGDDNDDIQSAE